ncbi:MAG: VanZ family protein [Chryseobacterium sp.]|uniref:VanZ family protein n=1 Tax=Chryseobacterium sp. TaxID=1871047 RepID=UPI0025BD84EF|nr:VanZ family protein [Chryseobacterium sp.]MCJ7933171.1 VanZ family protein [Chryseobacterium sp.]
MLKKIYKIIIIPYPLFLLYLMFFGMGRHQMEDHLIRLNPVLSTIEFMKDAFQWKYTVMIVLGNMIMFIPFGFLGWIFPKFKDLKTLLMAFVSCIVIVEALQYFTRLGIFEVDDVLLNSFGVYWGWLLSRWIEKRLTY